jgi:hypothetical protein
MPDRYPDLNRAILERQMAKYSAVTAVIFDLDGIILDTEPMSRRIVDIFI